MQFILNFKLTIPFKIFELILSQNIKVNFSIPDWQDVWILINSFCIKEIILFSLVVFPKK